MGIVLGMGQIPRQKMVPQKHISTPSPALTAAVQEKSKPMKYKIWITAGEVCIIYSPDKVKVELFATWLAQYYGLVFWTLLSESGGEFNETNSEGVSRAYRPKQGLLFT